MPSEHVIVLKNVTKMYGSIMGVKDVTLKVPKGSVFGFLGPNGAGKTTTINMMVDLLRPTDGSIEIFGLDSRKDSIAIRRQTGYLDGDMALDSSLTGWQQLEYFASFRGQFDKSYVRELAKRLDCKLSRKFKALSRGNKQKVGLIAALMHKPDLLILDEPTTGLDPLIQAEFYKIILEQKERGATTFISSHVLSEVEEICDHVAFIRQGKLVAITKMEEILNKTLKQVSVAGVDKTLKAKLKSMKKVSNFTTFDSSVRFDYGGDINTLLKQLTGSKLKDVTIKELELEEVFMKYYGGDRV